MGGRPLPLDNGCSTTPSLAKGAPMEPIEERLSALEVKVASLESQAEGATLAIRLVLRKVIQSSPSLKTWAANLDLDQTFDRMLYQPMTDLSIQAAREMLTLVLRPGEAQPPPSPPGA